MTRSCEQDTQPFFVEFERAPYSCEWHQELATRLGETTCRLLGIYTIPDEFLLSVVIPVYNERDTLEQLLQRVCAIPIRKEILLVDDGSADGTRAILHALEKEPPYDENNRLRMFYHDRNRGKGRALRTGFEKATGDIVLVQDADLEYDPAEYPRLLHPILDGRADVVYGSRFLGDRARRVTHYWHYLANNVLTTLSNCFTNLNLTDMETCYKVFRREVLHEITPTLRQNRFGFEPEVTAKVARAGKRVYEIAISYNGRSYEEGKKIRLRDALNALWCIVRYGVFRRSR